MNISTANSSSVSDLNAQGTSIVTASCAINLILSVPTNGYVLWLIATGAGGRMASDFFSLNLALSEILVCLSSVFFIVSTHVKTTAVFVLVTFGISLLYIGRPLFQSCVCVERYLAVVHPVVFLKYKPLRYRVGCCGVAWLMVLGDCLFGVLLCGTSIYNYAYSGQNLILMFLMLFCCLSVLRALKQPGPGEGDREREGTNNRKMRAFKIILIILVSVSVSYLPVIVIMSLSDVLNVVALYFSHSIALSITVITGFVQPLLFLHRSEKLPCIGPGEGDRERRR
ncbi:P2Y purinoceptor 8 [Coregonus clupeaformis]|uniref:P2Y purinoceptor 8 n=1 Tax=Coregonus clupeaformis TaxID=59861 RepID=UPI001E1C4334|nr:P2Y purinoceptor 8 [Coregonus clupeaformis]